MRETIREWKEEWLATNGPTDEIEVLIIDLSKDENYQYIYEGSFINIPEELENEKVLSSAQVIESSIPERKGAYSLIINQSKECHIESIASSAKRLASILKIYSEDSKSVKQVANALNYIPDDLEKDMKSIYEYIQVLENRAERK